MSSKQSGRRQFLKGAALVGLATGGLQRASGQQSFGPDKPEQMHDMAVRPRGEVSRYETTVRTGAQLITQGLTPLQDSMGIITPSALFFYVNHENGARPYIDPSKHRLLIDGLVERPLVLTMEEIKRLPSTSRIYYVECNGNSSLRSRALPAKTVQESHGRVGCAEWTGVPLSLLLEEAGVKKGANWLLATSADPSRHVSSLPMEKAMDDILVAYGQNGEALRVENGYPLRLIIPGWGGRIHMKWLNRIKVVDRPYMTVQDSFAHIGHSPAGQGAFLMAGEKARHFHYTFPFAKSVITFPSGEDRLSGPGYYEITGLAWSGTGAVRRVEVTTDGGRTWKDAKLQEPVLPHAFTRFRLPWHWGGEEAMLQSRCTSVRGDIQPTIEEMYRIWGNDPSEACHEVMGEGCSRIPIREFHAFIMSWGVNRDGSVYNAFKL